MSAKIKVILVAGPTASGKSSRAVEEAISRGGEVISVDSRQVYRTLDIGTEKIGIEEMHGIPHHLIDIREPSQTYSAGDFAIDANRLILDMSCRGTVPILAGGTHFYFDAFLHGLAEAIPTNFPLQASLGHLADEELFAKVAAADPRRARELDPKNRRRLMRALEIIEARGTVPERTGGAKETYDIEWIVIDPPDDVLRPRIEARLKEAFARGLIAEVERTRALVGDARLTELGLEYRIVGEYLRGERTEESMLPALSAKLWQYARRQKAWLRKLTAAR